MARLDWLRHHPHTPSTSTMWTIFAILFVLSVLLTAFWVGPNDELGPLPVADWNYSETASGDVLLTHEGGENIPRDALHITYGHTQNDTQGYQSIPDLGDETDPRLNRPFPNPTVSNGNTLILDGAALEHGAIRLVWTTADGDASGALLEREYPAHTDTKEK